MRKWKLKALKKKGFENEEEGVTITYNERAATERSPIYLICSSSKKRKRAFTSSAFVVMFLYFLYFRNLVSFSAGIRSGFSDVLSK
jgi:hypothetical protein